MTCLLWTCVMACFLAEWRMVLKVRNKKQNFNVKYWHARSNLLVTCDTKTLLVSISFRCKDSIDFSMNCAWLLGSYSYSMNKLSKRMSRAQKLRNLILSGELNNLDSVDKSKRKDKAHYARNNAPSPSLCRTGSAVDESYSHRHKRKGHKRSKSDANSGK